MSRVRIQVEEIIPSDDFRKNMSECNRQIAHFKNAPGRPEWMKHFRFELREKHVYIGVSYEAKTAKANSSVTVGLNQPNSVFVAELKKYIIFFQRLSSKCKSTVVHTFNSCDGNCSWSRVDKKYPTKIKVTKKEDDPWVQFTTQ